MIDKIRKYPDEVLNRVAEPVELDAKAKFLANRLTAALDADRKGRLAVAAPQIGVSKRAFSYRLTGGYMEDVEDKTIPVKGVAFNPIVHEQSDRLRSAIEGCLSFPGESFPIRRPDRIDVEWTDYKGNVYRTAMLNMAARVFLHEIDHLDGVLVIDRVEAPIA